METDGSRADRRQAVLDRVRNRIEARVQLGLVRPGDRLLSARELSRELQVDRRLILTAYGRLEAEGLVERRERSGVFLAASAHVPGGPVEQVNEWLADVLVDGLARGIRVPELPGRVRAAAGSLRLRAVCVECNTDQLHALCHELGEDYGLSTEPLELAAALRPGEAERGILEGADVVITTASHAAALAPVTRKVGKPLATIDLNPELWRELARVLEVEPVYIVSADHRLRAKLADLFERAVGVRNLHFLVVGRDDLASIPPNAVVYATRKARPRLEARTDLRLVPERRVFSLDSARLLLRKLLQPASA